MQSLRGNFSVAVLISILLAAIAFSYEPLPAPSFTRVNFLRTAKIDKMTLEKALELSNRHASIFLAPFDAVMLHVEIDGVPKDIFIISDISQRRLTIWLCSVPDVSGSREIEAIKAYYGQEGDSLKAPSGLDTNAKNRLFIAGQDFIYLADRGNGRIIEYTYYPDISGGQLVVNRILGQGQLHYPMDVAISAYGKQTINDADLYVVDAGSFNGDGALARISLAGDIEGIWQTFYFAQSTVEAIHLIDPVSVACYPDTAENNSLIYIAEDDNEQFYCLKSTSDETPEFCRVRPLSCNSLNCKIGGLAVDDFGRIYAANTATGQIDIYGPYFNPQYDSFGKPGTAIDELNYPKRLIIDTYHKPAEALMIECYDRFSGFQSFLVEEATSPTPPPLGFATGGLPKINAGSIPRIPKSIQVGEAYPNPFNSSCLISFTAIRPTHVKIDVFNLLGQLVATPFDKSVYPGEQTVKFDGADLCSGVYFYRLASEDYCLIRKLVLLK